MKHPVAGIVRDERDFDAFLRRHEHGILPFAISCGPSIARQHPEAVSVQVDWMPPGGIVRHIEEKCLSTRGGNNRIVHMTGRRNAIYRPAHQGVM